MRGGDAVQNSLLAFAGIVSVLAIQSHARLDFEDAVTRGTYDEWHEPSRGRRLAGGKNEYDGALRTISEIWNLTASSAPNGIPGSVQLTVSTSLVLVLGSLAAGAGVGGGGLFVPIYMFLLGAGPKGAVPLSKATILGGAIGNFLSIGRAKHPKADRPMIDYESSTFMQSGELLGVVFGVLLNNLLPAIAIVIFLVLILSWNSVRTLRKAVGIRRKETAAMDKAASAGKQQEVEYKTVAAVSTSAVDVEAAPSVAAQAAQAASGQTAVHPTDAAAATNGPAVTGAAVTGAAVTGAAVTGAAVTGTGAAVNGAAKGGKSAVSAELQAILQEDAKQYPLWAWALLCVMTAYTLGYSFIKKAIQRDANCRDWAYWLWYVTPIPVLGGFMYATSVLLSRRHKRKVAAGFEYLPLDMQWDGATLRRFPKTALLAGVTAGLLGIGGGMVIGPLFLAIGMEPQVGTSSCAFMILWTALSGVVSYGADGNLGAGLAVWCVSFGFISGQIGQRLVNHILKKTGRPSYVVFLLGSIIGAACIAMASGLIAKIIMGDYDANDIIEKNETAATHLFYWGSGFGCSD